MGIAESALILLGIGIVSQKFGAGLGLEQLGVGIKTLAAAPLGGVGLGLGEFSTGLRGFAESLGDIGRGFGTLFENIPKLPGVPAGPPGAGGGAFPPPRPGEVPVLPRLPVTPISLRDLSTVKAGGGSGELLPGGGGSTPPAPPPPPSQPSYIQPPRTVYYLTDPVSINDRLKPVMM